jgi:hypothetical protein
LISPAPSTPSVLNYWTCRKFLWFLSCATGSTRSPDCYDEVESRISTWEFLGFLTVRRPQIEGTWWKGCDVLRFRDCRQLIISGHCSVRTCEERDYKFKDLFEMLLPTFIKISFVFYKLFQFLLPPFFTYIYKLLQRQVHANILSNSS